MKKNNKCCIYLFNKLRNIRIKRHFHNDDYDLDFWEDLDLDDLDDDIKEAVIEYVRSSDDVSEWFD